MPYTPNFAPGDVLTAANMNSIGEAWQTFGSGANWKSASNPQPALNNGTWSARYSQDNKIVRVRGRIVMGSTTTFGTGAYRLDLPVNASTSGWASGDILGFAQYHDSGVNHLGIIHYLSATQVAFITLPVNLNLVTLGEANPTSPFPFANGDYIGFHFTYEAA